MARRILIPEGTLATGRAILDDDVAVHVRDVLRLDAGARILLSDGAGKEGLAELVEVTKRRVAVDVGELTISAPPGGLELTLVQAVGKGDKMDAVVRQASELGVRTIAPVLSERAVARHEGKVDRWRAIAEDATRVSGRPFRPRIEPVVPLAELLRRPRAELALCAAGGVEESLGSVLERVDRPRGAEVLVGPEGGLTDAELTAAREAGFVLVHLGPYTLRTESAGPALVAVLSYWARAFGW